MINHSPGDLIATVSADVGLAELNAELAKAGQMLALDPPGADRLTVAEVFDQALSGPRSHRYGEPREGKPRGRWSGRRAIAISAFRGSLEPSSYHLGRLFRLRHEPGTEFRRELDDLPLVQRPHGPARLQD